MDKKTAKELDKYYTRPEIARQCADIFYGKISPSSLLVEPSAGAGSFLLGDREIIGLDLRPESPNVIQHDFLADDLGKHVDLTRDIAFLGNPPFGRKGDLAVEFINKALIIGSAVGFILPIQFRKWSAQKRILAPAKLIVDQDLPEDSFTFVGQPYRLRCSFQIWTNNSPDPDLRIRTRPITAHRHFEMWQFNRTKEAEKFFHYDWDFAVPRQGYNDYSFKAFEESHCDRKKQWIFFKAGSPVVRDRLLKLDFEQLSLLNSGIPGFGKADVVSAYTALYGP